MPTVKDRRSLEEQNTHNTIIMGTDRGMSGWGGATGGLSVAAWACRPVDAEAVEAWVRARSDLDRVRVTDGIQIPPGCVHYSLYVVHDEHAARGGV